MGLVGEPLPLVFYCLVFFLFFFVNVFFFLSQVHTSLRLVHESLAQERQKLQEAWNSGELPASSQQLATLLEVRPPSLQSLFKKH